MAIPDFAHGIKSSFLETMTRSRHRSTPANIAQSTAAAPNGSGPASGDNAPTFSDLLDIVNPLQHIPVVSTIYRAITHDDIKPLARVVGDTLYGGGLGFVSSLADVEFQKATGKDFGDTVLTWLGMEGGSETSGDTAIAANAPDPKDVMVTAQATAPTAATKPPTPLLSGAQDTKPVPVAPAQAITVDKESLDALIAAVNNNSGLDPELGKRAIAAYQKSSAITDTGNNAQTVQ